MNLHINTLIAFQNLRDFGLTLSDFQSKNRTNPRDLFLPDDVLRASDLEYREALAERVASRA